MGGTGKLYPWSGDDRSLGWWLLFSVVMLWRGFNGKSTCLNPKACCSVLAISYSSSERYKCSSFPEKKRKKEKVI